MFNGLGLKAPAIGLLSKAIQQVIATSLGMHTAARGGEKTAAGPRVTAKAKGRRLNKAEEASKAGAETNKLMRYGFKRQHRHKRPP